MSMPPQLTETWGAAYVQLVVVLLVFVLGLPALMYQVAMPEDIRRIYYARVSLRPWLWLMDAILIAGVALAFVWVLHPCRTEVPDWTAYVSAGLVSVALVGVVAVLWLSSSRSGRSELVSEIQRQMVSRIHRQGALPESLVADLAYLGEQGAHSREKQVVVDALGHIVSVITARSSYRGSELRQVVHALVDMLQSVSRPGDDGNYWGVVTILDHIRRVGGHCAPCARETGTVCTEVA